VRLDIGGGTAPAAGFVNLDPIHGEGEFRRRIQDGIPLPDASVEAARCSHLMEHIPVEDRIAAFNEVWRVLIPGGEFEIAVPLFGTGWGAIADPTHVSFWVKESFDYFTGDMTANADYGIRFWEWVEWRVYEGQTWGSEGHARLRKPL
jgi:SAM-dependent methyltransferase